MSFFLLSPPISSPLRLTTRSLLSPPIFSLYPHSSSCSSLYGRCTPRRTILSFHYRARGESKVNSMAKSSNRSFSICYYSSSSFGGGGGNAELEGRSREIEEEVEDDDGSGSEEEEVEIEGIAPTSVSPERWDVLGLGQAMVISCFPVC